MAGIDAVKEECFRPLQFPVKIEPGFRSTDAAANGASVVEISSGSESSGGDARQGRGGAAVAQGEILSSSAAAVKRAFSHSEIADTAGSSAKRPRTESPLNVQRSQGYGRKGLDGSFPSDFLQPLADVHQRSFSPRPARASPIAAPVSTSQKIINKQFRQFWKAGDYESDKVGHKSNAGGMDHIRVHPKFLHSNATSHKWALGAIAELLDNALDEVVHGATFVKIDKIENPKNGEPMLLIEDDGGGMNPDNIRQCMSLGYSAKSKIANTIGQYGNGFKTSTMRLGADVIVFSRCRGNNGRGSTQSVGMLSYTFLRETGQEDIIVPMIDYEIQPFGLRKVIRSNVDDWTRNMESIQRWSPYATEAEFMDIFKEMKTQGTKIIIYNLWEDDQGQLELEFNADRYDIQLRGVNRDEKQITMAERFPHSRHYLTYQHSLRIYASILYLKLPPGFRMFLRGKEIEYHDIVDDLMFTEVWTYRPVASDVQTDTGHMKAVVTVGFVKDAKEHIDVQGFNVYHKNRLIKPFWRLWNSAASRGRGIIGVLEANFVEPAHDKQGFERTIVLARLEARLVEMQKTYWSKHCHKVGYVNLSLRGKDGKAAESNGQPLPAESTPPVLAAPLSMNPLLQTPLSVPPSTRPTTLASSVPTFSAGYGTYSQNVPVPPALARSQQLQAQVQLSRRANEGITPVTRQAGSVPSPSVGVLPHWHSSSTRNQTVPSNLPETGNTRLHERVHGHIHSATRSTLPQHTPSTVSLSRKPEVVNPYNAIRTPFPQPSPGIAPSLQRPEVVSQAVSLSSTQPNVITPAQQTTQCSSIPKFAVQSSSHYSTVGRSEAQSVVPGGEGLRPIVGSTGSNLAQGLPMRSTMPEEDSTAKSPGQFGETFRSVASTAGQDLVAHSLVRGTTLVGGNREQSVMPGEEVLRPDAGSLSSLTNSANTKNLTSSMPGLEANIHPPNNCGVPASPVSPPMQDVFVSGTGLKVEDNRIHALDACGVKGKDDDVNLKNKQNGQSFVNSTNSITPKAQGVVQNNVEVSASVENVASPLLLADLSGNTHISPGTEMSVPQTPCVPSELDSHTSLGTGGNFLHASQIPAEQCPSKVSRLTGKETALGRKSLENLGRMFAKKAAGLTMNQDDQVTDLKKAPVEELTESGVNTRSIVQSGSNLELDAHIIASRDLEAHKVSNQQLESRLVVLELEVTALQQRLDSLKMERDSLRRLLLEERLQGRLHKEELQLKVEQTWAKVKELEAQNGRMLLIQGGNGD